MASPKRYTYQIKGNKLSLLEVDVNSGESGLNYEYTGTTGENLPFGTSGDALDISSGSSLLKSPITSVTDGLELEYAYSPNYRINDASETTACERIAEDNGYLKFVDLGSALPTSGITHCVVGGTEKFNGLHKVTTANAGYYITDTKYNGAQLTVNYTVYHDVSALEDESSVIDLPLYLSKALVYYVKAKMAEDTFEIEAKEYFMREFRKMVEKHENSKVTGMRAIMPGLNAIK
tara:strand:+ start:327 stop:1028 length:702 start_codon:yes stop_codon:yes gene_type:complete